MNNTDLLQVDSWLAFLEGVIETSDGWRAFCPAHEDEHRSFHVTHGEEGNAVVHCFAGCTYREIIEAVQDEARIPKVILRPTKSVNGLARDWWQHYTNVPADFWESLGVLFEGDTLSFSWESVQTKKKRLAGEKNPIWEPPGGLAPPIWPEIPYNIGNEIWLTEGESDAGVLRYLGYPAFAFTKGAGSTNKLEPVWDRLIERGIRRVTIVGDCDEAGKKFANTATAQAQKAGLTVFQIHTIQLVDVLLGEKDVRDGWLRSRDKEEFIQRINDARHEIHHNLSTAQFVEVTELLRRPEETRLPWLVEDFFLHGATGMMVGDPKIGKTWIVLDLLTSIATGRPFLGHLPVERMGSTIYVTKEDTLNSLGNRMSKILSAKGFGGRSILQPQRLTVSLPRQTPFNVYIALDSAFTLSKIDTLFPWLDSIAEREKIQCIAFDPVLRMTGGDTFRADDVVNEVFNPASMCQSRYDTSVMLVHHKPKGVPGRSYYGSVAFHASSDQITYVSKYTVDNADWVQVEVEAKSTPEKLFYCQFGDLEMGYNVHYSDSISPDGAGVQIRTNYSGVEMLILDVVRNTPDIPIYTLSRSLSSVPHSELFEALSKLERRGVLTESNNRYRVNV